MGCKKICKIIASELGSKSGVMRGFQKGITLGSRTSGSAWKVCCGGGGGVGWRDDNRVSKVQRISGSWIFFFLMDLDLWIFGLPLDFRLTIGECHVWCHWYWSRVGYWVHIKVVDKLWLSWGWIITIHEWLGLVSRTDDWCHQYVLIK